MRCAVCSGPGEVGNPELQAVLCRPCDGDFCAWHGPRRHCLPIDWPKWSTTARQRARDAMRDLAASATARPLNLPQRDLLAAWHVWKART